MQRKIEDVIYSNRDNVLFIDVRSPYEFNEGTIPGSINMPIFNNEERIEIGKLYKNESIEAAKCRGIELAGSKFSYIYKKILDLKKNYKDIIIFCYRGGLRSTSIVELLRILGIKTYQLIGGYKEFRRFTIDYIENIDEKHEFLVLHGYTGVGKTKLLSMLKNKEVSVLNMAVLAKNTGSVFGNIIFSEAVITQKMFEGLLVYQLTESRKKLIIVESESKRIGNIHIPDSLYKAINNGKHILINTTMENRINRLVAEYVEDVSTNAEVFIRAIRNLKKTIGNEGVERYIKYIHNKEYKNVARELVINYYDPLYKYPISKYNYDLYINYDTIEMAEKEIENYYVKLEGKIDQ